MPGMPPLSPPPIDPERNKKKSSPPPELSRSHIYAPSGFVFKAGDTLFRVPTLWMISKSSPLFGGIVGLTPGGNGENGNGSSEDDPIILEVSSKDFEAYCNWQYVLKFPLEPRDWIGVLCVSLKYCIDMGVDQSVHNLLVKKQECRFNPIYKLRMVWQFQLEKWYDDSITDVLQLPFTSLTAHDISDLGPKLTEVFIALRERFVRHRIELMTHVQEVKHDSACLDNADCAKEWRVAYSKAMLFFGQTRKYLSGREVIKKLDAIFVPNLNAYCREHTFETIFEKGFLWQDEEFISTTASAIKKFISIHRPQEPLPEPRFQSDAPAYSVFQA